MTVKELIEALRKFPEDVEVIAYNSVDGDSKDVCVYAEGSTGEKTADAEAVKVAMVV